MDVADREIRRLDLYPVVAVSIRNPTPIAWRDLDHSDASGCVNRRLYPVAQPLGAVSWLGGGYCERDLDGSDRQFQCDLSTVARRLDFSRIQCALQLGSKFSCGRSPDSFVQSR